MTIIETEHQDILFKASNYIFRDAPAIDIEEEETSNPWYNGGDAL